MNPSGQNKPSPEVPIRIREITRDGWVARREIARRLGMKVDTATRYLNALEDAGELAMRRVRTDDGRLVCEHRMIPQGYVPPLYPGSKEDASALASCFGGYTFVGGGASCS